MNSADSESEEDVLYGEENQQAVGLLSYRYPNNTAILNMEARAEHQKTRMYRSLYVLATSLGVGTLVLILYWVLQFRGGLGWSEPKIEFNWHPLLMVFGMVFLYSQSILAYRTGRNAPKRKLKLTHAILHFSAFIFAVIGLKAAFDSHNYAKPPIPNLYTLHSWIGLITVILFAGQFLGGFITFLLPGLSRSIRQAVLPAHTALGTAGFVLALVSTVMGLTEKVLWTLGDNYSKSSSEGILVNFIGVMVTFFGVTVLYLVNESDYKRLSLPEDEMVLAGTD